MPHIELPVDLPGIVGLLQRYGDTGEVLSELAEKLLRRDKKPKHSDKQPEEFSNKKPEVLSNLKDWERELIATRVSAGNNCHFCSNSHGAATRHLENSSQSLIADILAKRRPEQLEERLASLLDIADKVRQDPQTVSAADIERARVNGWGDVEIHETVLIAAAFCMYNRYVDGLATLQPRDEALYDMIGIELAQKGYVRAASAM